MRKASSSSSKYSTEYSQSSSSTKAVAHACKRAGKFGDNLSCNAREVSHAEGASSTTNTSCKPHLPLAAPPPADLQVPTTMQQDHRFNGHLTSTTPHELPHNSTTTIPSSCDHCHCTTPLELPYTACLSTPLHEHIMAPHPTNSLSWRSSNSDQSSVSSHNAALHRALASLKKPPAGGGGGEPDAVTKIKPQRPPLGHVRGVDSFSGTVHSDIINERSITSADARTLSMRERGRWGNSKMQQQLSGAGAAGSVGSHGHAQKPNLSTYNNQQQPHHQQPLQHVQCLHCGSFSTTPVAATGAGGGSVAGVIKGARSHSFGRRVRDYSWQQELLQEHKKPSEQQQHQQLHFDAHPASELSGLHHHHPCEFACCRDVYESGGALKVPPKLHHASSMSWQERYMLLCQAIAAGAFVDADSADEFSGPLQPRPARRAGYSWAECECPACEASAGGNGGGGGGGRSFGRRPHNTSNGERMMELEAFSGPLGYVSESKSMAELSSVKEKLGRRGSRWWARLPMSFGRAKSSSAAAAAPIRAAGQTTAQCVSCGQRVWAAATGGGEEEAEAGRRCPDCMAARGGGTEPSKGGAVPAGAAPPTSARPAGPAPAAGGGRQRVNQPPGFAFHHQQHHQYYQKHSSMPRRWRLMKLCRYLMGFPMQR